MEIRPSAVNQLVHDRGVRLGTALAVAVAIPVAVLFYFQFRSISALSRSSAVVLRQLSQETGGRAFFPSQLADLVKVYSQISDELSSQYTVGYTSRNPRRDGAWRRIVVRVAGERRMARTKQGYFAPTAAR